jgi:hypothetical protein
MIPSPEIKSAFNKKAVKAAQFNVEVVERAS